MIFKVIDVVGSLSVNARVQVNGLDEELHGETAYACD